MATPKKRTTKKRPAKPAPSTRDLILLTLTSLERSLLNATFAIGLAAVMGDPSTQLVAYLEAQVKYRHAPNDDVSQFIRKMSNLVKSEVEDPNG